MLAEKLAEANKRADALAAELEQSETARMKAEADAATVEDLQKRLDDAKNALSENVAQHSAREEEILSRLESQSRRFVSKCSHPCCFLASCFGPFFPLSNSFLCFKQGEHTKSMSWRILKVTSSLMRFLSLKSMVLKLVTALLKLRLACHGFSLIFSRRRRNPQFLLISPSASLPKKTLDSNFAKKG
jgi:hypothetical protein